MKVSHSGILCWLLLTCAVLITGCQADDAYTNTLEQWGQERVQRLKTPRGWLSLGGLFPVHPGQNSVGFTDTDAIRFPGPARGSIGTITLDSTQLSWVSHDGRVNTDSGRPYSGGSFDITNPPLLNLDSYYWTFLERSGNYYLRLWDTLSPARQELHDIPCFPPDKGWRINATFTAAEPGVSIVLDDVLGLRRDYPVKGRVSAVKDDIAFSLIALDGGEDELFIIFEDATSGLSTYDAGRYLYTLRPTEDGTVEIDFNKAYNPPCAFTEYATCLLAPPENRLPFAVTAGEKSYGH